MNLLPHKICVVVVTYGSRWLCLEQVLNRALEFSSVSQIVIVNNASDYDIEAKLNALNDSRIHLISFTENSGSAGGYQSGIKYAVGISSIDLIWLLDDDNLPDKNLDYELLQEWAKITSIDNKDALFCLREDRRHHVKIALGENPNRYYLVNNNFLGFNLFRVFYNQFKKLTDKFKHDLKYQPKVALPYTPYGGLLFHKFLISRIGLPDERFFLYVDDSEFTYRITQNGGTIWLVPSCKITDIDKSVGINEPKKLFHSHLLDLWSFRTYYHVRNRMYFYSRVALKNNFIFAVNKTLYLSYLQLVSLLTSKKNEYRKLLQAVNDGLAGRLGKADNDKF